MSKDTMVLIQFFTLIFQIIVVPIFSGVTHIVLNVICLLIITSLCILRFRSKE